jgi:hypothetical protein
MAVKACGRCYSPKSGQEKERERERVFQLGPHPKVSRTSQDSTTTVVIMWMRP